MKLKNIRRPLFLTLLIPCALVMTGTPARAQLNLQIISNTLSGLPGDTLSYTGTLINSGTTELFLNSDLFNLTGTGLTLDDSPFLTNFPLSILGGETFTGSLFTVNIGATPPGLYNGTFTILGGTTDTDQNPLVTGNFAVTVNATAPEPASGFLILGSVLPATGLWYRRRRANGTTV